MQSIQEAKKRTIESKEVVLRAENLGVSFNMDFHRDDYKSHFFNMFRAKKKEPSHKQFWPLRNIDFEGYKGEILGIIGSNGSGKTTLCKLLAGILQPDEGRVHAQGKVSALFSLGMGFKKDLTGRENVYLNGMMLGIRKKMINKFIDEIHHFSGIGSFIDQPLKTYSSGMKARLGFSVAAFLEPEILILDESLNTGDMEFAERATLKMKEIVAKAKMVILVTHSLPYARKNCDRLIWIDQGQIKAIGDPKETLELYKASVPDLKKQKRKKKLDMQKTHTQIKDSTVIKADNIGVSYKMGNGLFWALKNTSFEIKEGEVVGIVGRNGAGKSTLCKLMTNILTPDEGQIELNGDTTALLSYGAGFNPQLTGKDNIFLNGLLLGIPKERVMRDYSKIVDFSGLEKFMDKPVKNYSSGMRARLGFSIAALLQPDIFIIDEALSTGDMDFKQKASERIQEMMEHAKAVIIVSHSMNFVEQVCTRAIWFDNGEIQFDGNPKEAVKLYKSKNNNKIPKSDK